ncbi:MAG: potassium channel family protein, partial [Syntrophales bacterium]
MRCIEQIEICPKAQVGGSLSANANGKVFTFLMLLVVLAMTAHPKVQIVSAMVVTLAVAFRWITNFVDSPQVFLGSMFFSLSSILIFLVIVLGQVYKEGPVTVHRIQGAIAAYLLFAMSFSITYNIIEFLHPGSFVFPSQQHPLQPNQMESFLYFSISTLTTVGFGDITAVHSIARSLVMLESVIGSLYPPILIGILVSLHIRWRWDKK